VKHAKEFQVRTDGAVFFVGNRQEDPVAYRLSGRISPFARLRCLKVFFCHKSPLLCRICLPETAQAFLGLLYAPKLQAAPSAGAGSFFNRSRDNAFRFPNKA
jgi:hypothetical protein